MKKHHVFFWAAAVFTLSACAGITCEDVSLKGEEALNAIAKHEQLLPNTYLAVPEGELTASTREVETLLNELQGRGLLIYIMRDSSRRLRSLAGKEPGAVVDSATFYRYELKWDPLLIDAYKIKTDSVQQVVALNLLGRELPGEVHYRSRFLRKGDIHFSGTDSLYYRRNCRQLSYRCTYSIDSLNQVAAIAGYPPVSATVRAVNRSLQQAQ